MHSEAPAASAELLVRCPGQMWGPAGVWLLELQGHWLVTGTARLADATPLSLCTQVVYNDYLGPTANTAPSSPWGHSPTVVSLPAEQQAVKTQQVSWAAAELCSIAPGLLWPAGHYIDNWLDDGCLSLLLHLYSTLQQACHNGHLHGMTAG